MRGSFSTSEDGFLNSGLSEDCEWHNIFLSKLHIDSEAITTLSSSMRNANEKAGIFSNLTINNPLEVISNAKVGLKKEGLEQSKFGNHLMAM